jgi:hypothetical protein
MLRPTEQEAGLCAVGARWNSQSNGCRKLRETRRVPDVLEPSLDATFERSPVEVRRARKAPEGEDKAVCHGRAEQRFR